MYGFGLGAVPGGFISGVTFKPSSIPGAAPNQSVVTGATTIDYAVVKGSAAKAFGIGTQIILDLVYLLIGA